MPYLLSDFWRDVRNEIDAGRPVVATTPVHVFVVIGYVVVNGQPRITINDPWVGSYQVGHHRPPHIEPEPPLRHLFPPAGWGRARLR